MQTLPNIALAAVMALSGLPHVFCACGCAGGTDSRAAKRSAPACPHCRPVHDEDSGHKKRAPRPCECHHCDQVQATRPTPAVSVSQPDAGTWVAAPLEAAIDPAAAVGGCEPSGALGPPGSLAATPTSIPILLGHLLL